MNIKGLIAVGELSFHFSLTLFLFDYIFVFGKGKLTYLIDTRKLLRLCFSQNLSCKLWNQSNRCSKARQTIAGKQRTFHFSQMYNIPRALWRHIRRWQYLPSHNNYHQEPHFKCLLSPDRGAGDSSFNVERSLSWGFAHRINTINLFTISPSAKQEFCQVVRTTTINVRYYYE